LDNTNKINAKKKCLLKNKVNPVISKKINKFSDNLLEDKKIEAGYTRKIKDAKYDADSDLKIFFVRK
jgi:hypothetical protein